MTNNSEMDTIYRLSEKIKSGHSTKPEVDEYMKLLFKKGSISQAQYDDYVNGKNSESFVKTALTIGAIILLGYLISKLTDD